MRTNVPNIYAIGDCAADSAQLAHAASAQGLNAVSHILGEPPAVNMNAIPACVYTNPEIATVGLTDKEAEAAGYKVKVGKYIMSGNGKSILTNEDRGFIKLVFDASNDVLIGAHLMCARATDIIGEAAYAVANGQKASQLASVIRPHPTYMEGMTEAVESLFGTAVHVIRGKG
jgi:dihydrolipoamide dehydrogenase